MGASYFVIAVLGCSDGGSTCTPVATLQTHYATEAQCSAATAGALEKNTDFDFPTLLARCSAGSAEKTADARLDKRPQPKARRS